MELKVGSRRADTPGYLEFIWVENGTENPQAVALITDISGTYAASYGTWTCQGETVAEVKEQLFSKMTTDVPSLSL
jgi:hypothetical protein